MLHLRAHMFTFVLGMMPARYLRHGAQPEEEPVLKEMPMMQPFWAAGFSFSRGHFKVQVPYDAYQPMVFQVHIPSLFVASLNLNVLYVSHSVHSIEDE